MDAVIERSEITRESTIKAIKRALEKRSGKPWSVTGGRGTAWGWLTIDAPPARRTWGHRLKADASPAQLPSDYEEYNTGLPGHYMGPEDRAELAKLLGLDKPAHMQGVQVPSSNDHYQEYMERAAGLTPTKIAQALGLRRHYGWTK